MMRSNPIPTRTSPEYNREYRAAHREERNAYARDYAKQNPDVNRRAKVKHRYGITYDDFLRLNEEQAGLCAICDSPPRGGRARLDIDHDHRTNTVRGLLCNRCNRALGFLDDRLDLVVRTASYLEGR